MRNLVIFSLNEIKHSVANHTSVTSNRISHNIISVTSFCEFEVKEDKIVLYFAENGQKRKTKYYLMSLIP